MPNFRIPLNCSPSKAASVLKLIIEAHKRRFGHLAVTKPGRTLGAVFIEKWVAKRMPVHLCPTCTSRYGSWYKRHSYTPIWNKLVNQISDCDGCDSKNVYTSGFFPSEHRCPYVIPSIPETSTEKPLGSILCIR